MAKTISLGPGIFQVAGAELSDSRDAAGYLIEDDGDLALIDVGAGPSYRQIVANIQGLGLNLKKLRYVIATHAHIDHIGALADFARDYSPTLAAHELDAWAMETADPAYTAASWYGLALTPVPIDLKLKGPRDKLVLGRTELICLHAPGHTPGSLAVYLDRSGRRYLFGQDIHGPFHPGFKSDQGAWRRSMALLLELEADVLGEGHFGIHDGRKKVADFIRGFLNDFPCNEG
ncbi:MAG: MBL fold metallo-hydrolase [Thermodesulfobacteriota bacterium]